METPNQLQHVEAPHRMSDKNAQNGEDMLEVLAHDIMRYEMLTEQEEVLASALLEGCVAEEVSDNENELLQDVSSRIDLHTNERFLNVTEKETDKFVMDNMNRNTISKTKSDLKIFYDWTRSNGVKEYREVQDIPPPELDSLLARFYLGVRKMDGTEYEPDTISSITNSIHRHHTNHKINVNIKNDDRFAHSRRVLEAKRKQLKSEGLGKKKNKAEPLNSTDTMRLYEKQILGYGMYSLNL